MNQNEKKSDQNDQSKQSKIVPAEFSEEPTGYLEFLEGLKKRIQAARIKAVLSVNRELILLYWQIGREVLEKQKEEGWGSKIIDHLSSDLRHAFPEMKGFSPRNLKYMRALTEAYPDEQFVQEVLAQITWYHNLTLLEKVKDLKEREWYVRAVARISLIQRFDTAFRSCVFYAI